MATDQQALAPVIHLEAPVAPTLVQVNHTHVVPGVFSDDEDPFTGVLVQIEGSLNGEDTLVSHQFVFTVEQWVELQLLGEMAAQEAFGMARLMR